MAQLGETLKAARENQGLSLDEVEQATHIRRHLLQALEENKTDVFPSPVIARGLIRNYAKFLKLDPVEALTMYDGKGRIPVKGQRVAQDGIEFMNLSMAPRSYFNMELIIGVVLGFLVVSGVWYLANGTLLEAPAITATPTNTPRTEGITEDSALLLPTTTPLPTNTPTALPPTGTPTPVIYSGVTVELSVLESSWVQILVDDNKIFEGILEIGDTPSWTGEQRVAIRAGNGGGIEVIVNGINRGVMGAQGQVVDQIWEKVEDPSSTNTSPDSEPTGQLPQFNEPPTTATATFAAPTVQATPAEEGAAESPTQEDAVVEATPEG